MIKNIGKGLSVVLISMVLTSCGGGGGASGIVQTSPFSTISGTISDGPIENAKICITDVELDNEYCPTFTNNKGYYSFDYILENGKEYLITAYGSDVVGSETYDREDNLDGSGDPIALSFIMYQALKTSGSIASSENIGSSYKININPLTFREAVKNYVTTSSPIIIKELANDTSTNNDPISLFQNYILNKNTEYSTFYTEVKTEVKSVNTAALAAVTPTTTYVTITDETLKTQLIKGITYNTLGLENMISTHIAYKVIDDAISNNDTSSYSIFKKISLGTDTIVNFKYVITGQEYEGTLMYDASGNLLDANYWQNYKKSDDRGENSLSGYIKITKNGDLIFRKGTFKMYTDNHSEGYVSGKVTVTNALTELNTFDDPDNTISNSTVELTTKELPTEKIISSDLIGLWNGTYSVTVGTCLGGNIDLTFSNSQTHSWSASDSVPNTYGTELILDATTSIITLNNDTTKWSDDGKLRTDKTKITGTWIDGTCEGTFTTSKAIK